MIVLVGAGGHATACIDVLEQEGRFFIGGMLGLSADVGTKILGYDVIGTDADAPALLGQFRNALVTVGQIKTAEPRVRLFELLEKRGYQLPTIVSPHAYVSPRAQIGAGTIVMHGAIVNAGAVVGRNVILNSCSLVEHDTVVGDHCHISPSVTLNGGVVVGPRTFVGSGTCVRQGIRIGEDSVIGMGQRVVSDCLKNSRLPPFPDRA